MNWGCDKNISVLGIGSDFKFRTSGTIWIRTEEVSATVTFRTDTEDLSEYGSSQTGPATMNTILPTYKYKKSTPKQ